MNAILCSLSVIYGFCVLNAAPSESRWWRFNANHGTGFTDKMRMNIAFNISPSPNSSYTQIYFKPIFCLFLERFPFPKPLIMLSLSRCGIRAVMWICMTVVWMESRRYSTHLKCISRWAAVRRPGLTLTASTHLTSFEKSQWTINLAVLCWIWSLRLNFIYAGGK